MQCLTPIRLGRINSSTNLLRLDAVSIGFRAIGGPQNITPCFSKGHRIEGTDFFDEKAYVACVYLRSLIGAGK